MDRNGTVNASIPIHDISLPSCDTIKVLGVTLDSEMSFTPHITSLCARASRQINALRRISKFLNIESRLSIYKAFIFANFTYSPVTWLFCGKTNSTKLEKLQERAIRFVYNDYTSPYENLLSQANLMSLSMFRLRYLAIEVYRCVNNVNPAYLNELFTKHDIQYNLRDPFILYQPKFNTIKYGYRSFQYYGAKLWNALPVEIKNSENLYTFKWKLTNWCHSAQAIALERSMFSPSLYLL